MFERYTEQARRILFFARYETSDLGATAIETEHILLGLVREAKGMTGDLLARARLSRDVVRRQIEACRPIGQRIATSVEIPFSPETRRVLHYAAEEADRLTHSYIGAEHLLLGLLREEQALAASILREHGVELGAVRDEIARRTRGTNVVADEVEDVVEVIREREASWNAAIKARDIEQASDMLSSSYCLLIAIEGQPLRKISRAEWLATLETYELDSMFIDDMHVGVYRDVAIATLRYRQTGRIRGSDRNISGDFMLTDVWIKTMEGWRVVERHSSRAEPRPHDPA